MLGFLPQIDARVLSAVHLALAAGVTMHVLLHKRDIGASIGWIGLAWLSPILGSVIYLFFGINRVKRRASRLLDARPTRARRRACRVIARARRSPGAARARRLRDHGTPGRKRQRHRALEQWRRGLSAHARGDRRGARQRRAVELYLPRRYSRQPLHRGADPRRPARRRGARPHRRHRRRIFLLADLSAAAARRRPGRALPALAAAVAHAGHQFALAQEAARRRWPHRLHRRAQYRRRECAARPAASSGAGHPLRLRGTGGGATKRGVRRGLAVHRRRAAERRCVVSAPRRARRRCRPRGHLRSGSGSGEDRVHDPRGDRLREALDQDHDALLSPR